MQSFSVEETLDLYIIYLYYLFIIYQINKYFAVLVDTILMKVYTSIR